MVDKITIQELYEFWYQITDESFDSRLQIFFNMYFIIIFEYVYILITFSTWAKFLIYNFFQILIGWTKMEMVESQRTKSKR